MQPPDTRLEVLPGEMATTGATDPPTASFAALRRFARPRPPAERCELCGLELAVGHAHLLEHQLQRIVCACDACSILFCGQENAKFLRVPRRIVRLDNFVFSDLEWGAMMLPINLAFFLRGSDGSTRAMYPSPAGAMESMISLPQWDELFRNELALHKTAPEVEALLVNRIGEAASYFIVPIDACYQLVGLIRIRWRGLSGGSEAWQAIAEFFADLERRAVRPSGAVRA